MNNKESLKQQIDLEIRKEMRLPAVIHAPPTDLTKLIMFLDLTDKEEAAKLVEKIAELVNNDNLWHTSLVEVLAVFNWQDNLPILYLSLLKYLNTRSLHKFSCIFGHTNNLQVLTLNYLQENLARIELNNDTLPQLYNFLTLAYCVNLESFRQLVGQVSLKTSTDEILDSEFKYIHSETTDVLKTNYPDDGSLSGTVNSKQDKKRLKIAICISGQLRGYKHFQSTLSQLNLDDHDHQIFVSTWEKIGGRFPHLDQAHRIFPEQFAVAFREVILSIGEQHFRQRYPSLIEFIENPYRVTVDHLCDFYNTKYVDLQDDETDPFKAFSSIAKMHYKLGRCLELISKQSSDFDLIIRMRPDLQFLQAVSVDWIRLYQTSLMERLIFADFEPRISPRVINWQIGEVLPLMIGDLFAVGTFDTMRIYMDSFNENLRLIDKQLYGLPRGFMPHTTLSRILMYHNIGVKTFPYATITDKNLAEFTILNSVQIGQALHNDLQGRPLDQFDAHLLSTIKEVARQN